MKTKVQIPFATKGPVLADLPDPGAMTASARECERRVLLGLITDLSRDRATWWDTLSALPQGSRQGIYARARAVAMWAAVVSVGDRLNELEQEDQRQAEAAMTAASPAA